MEAGIVNNGPAGVARAEHSRDFSGADEGFGTWCFRTIKSVLCPCLVHPAETFEPLERVVPDQDLLDLNSRAQQQLYIQYIDGIVSELLSTVVDHSEDELQSIINAVVEDALTDIVLRQVLAAQSSMASTAMNASEDQNMALQSKIVSYRDLPEFIPGETSSIGQPECCCISEEEPQNMIIYAGRYYNYAIFVSAFMATGGLDPFTRMEINWQEVYKVSIERPSCPVNPGVET